MEVFVVKRQQSNPLRSPALIVLLATLLAVTAAQAATDYHIFQ